MNIEPLFDRVLLKPHKTTTQTSTIYIPETSNKSEMMEVVETSKNTEHKFVVKQGDKVLVNKYAGSEFIIENNTYILIKEEDILGIIKGE